MLSLPELFGQVNAWQPELTMLEYAFSLSEIPGRVTSQTRRPNESIDYTNSHIIQVRA